MAKPKLTPQQREEILLRRQAGERGVDLAAEYGVSKHTITRLAANPSPPPSSEPFNWLAVRSLYQGGEA